MEKTINLSEAVEGLELIEATLLNNIAGGSFDTPPFDCFFNAD